MNGVFNKEQIMAVFQNRQQRGFHEAETVGL